MQEVVFSPATVVVLAFLVAWAAWAVRRMTRRGLCDCGDHCGDSGCTGCSSASSCSASGGCGCSAVEKMAAAVACDLEEQKEADAPLPSSSSRDDV